MITTDRLGLEPSGASYEELAGVPSAFDLTLLANQLFPDLTGSVFDNAVTVTETDTAIAESTFTGTDVYMDVKGVQITSGTGSIVGSGEISASATGGAYTPKKYQVDVNYDKTTSVTQGTKTDGTVTKVVTPYTGT